MRTFYIGALAVALGAFAAIGTVQAEPPIKRTDMVDSRIDVPGHKVVQVRVDFEPGLLAPNHSHPGEEVAYVVEGTLEHVLEGRDPIVLNAGESLFIPSGVKHSARNVGKGRASELATYIVAVSNSWCRQNSPPKHFQHCFNAQPMGYPMRRRIFGSGKAEWTKEVSGHGEHLCI